MIRGAANQARKNAATSRNTATDRYLLMSEAVTLLGGRRFWRFRIPSMQTSLIQEDRLMRRAQ
jgi:hypothetical protein